MKFLKLSLIFGFFCIANIFIQEKSFSQEAEAGNFSAKISCSSEVHRVSVKLSPTVPDKTWTIPSLLPDGRSIKYYDGVEKNPETSKYDYICEVYEKVYFSVVWTKAHGEYVDFVINNSQFPTRSYSFNDMTDMSLYVANSKIKLRICELTVEKPGYHSDKDGLTGVDVPVFMDSYCELDTVSTLQNMQVMAGEAVYQYAKRDEWDHGPSFDCELASSYVDILICSDDNLTRMDRFMSGQYWRIVNWGTGVDSVVEEQKKWLSERSVQCGLPARPSKTKISTEVSERSVNCLFKFYAKRMQILGEYVRRIDVKERRVFE